MKKILLLFVFFASGLLAQEQHMQWSQETKKVSACEYDLIFKVKIAKDWHIYSIIPSTGIEAPSPTSFTFNANSNIEFVGKVIESPTHKFFDSVFKTIVRTHEHQATFTQRVKVLKDGPVKVTGKYDSQVCHDELGCDFPPVEDFKFEVRGSTECQSAITAATASASANPDSSATASAAITKDSTTLATEASPANPTTAAETGTENMSFWAIFLAGFLGGFAALLTPCVFPMIPMNVSFFTKQSKTKQQGIKNAFIYAIFLIVLYVGLGLGVTLIFGAGALHTLSTSVWFNLAFFILLLVFAISFLGAFEIVLPSSFVNKMDAKSDKGGLAGIFFMAFTLALVSFSCTGPIIGTLLVQAASTGSISGPFWGMFGFSLALSLPFGLFAAFPGWLNSLPKSGGWLNSVKVTLGFLELALALKFASNADLVVEAGYLTREVFITLWIVIFGLLTAYLLGAYKTSHDSDVKSISVTRLFFAIGAFFVTVYLVPGLWGAPLKLFSGILPPLEYSESPHGFGGSQNTAGHSAAATDNEFGKFMEVNKNGITYFKNDYDNALAYAKKVGKPLMVDFTGHACANCRKTEDYVWPDPEITKLLNNEVVLVSLYVDDKRALPVKDYKTVHWYGKERLITDIGDKFKYMEETLYGQSTQPLYVLLDHNEKPLNSVRGYNSSIDEYVLWMMEGIHNFKTKKQP